MSNNLVIRLKQKNDKLTKVHRRFCKKLSKYNDQTGLSVVINT